MHTRDLIIDSIAVMTADEMEDLYEQLQKAYAEKRHEEIRRNLAEAKRLSSSNKLYRSSDVTEIMQWLTSND